MVEMIPNITNRKSTQEDVRYYREMFLHLHSAFQHANTEESSLENVSLQIPDGQCVLLCGESGYLAEGGITSLGIMLEDLEAALLQDQTIAEKEQKIAE